eukprot:TRINITY_DN22224_c0_g1_i1.p2 TRINITY_DN22224_c0_g1~~TRINITY_DN22224_c0_g1_i1.p2  ORF type:complete len:136 (+),score=25.50 TRINITY_DN22224_c0_g1_i1:87-494(+)
MQMDFRVLGTAPTWIQGAEHRGISLQQLDRIRDFLQAHAAYDGAMVGHPADFLNAINLYWVNTWMILPSTQPYQCSMVELMAPPGLIQQQPRFFCSHWWGEPVLDFILAVENHAEARENADGKTNFYWVLSLIPI